MKRFALLASMLVACTLLHAQHPFSTQWRVLKNDKSSIKIIYPDGQARNAARIAESFSRVWATDTTHTGAKFRRYPLILSSTSTVSNGYVTTLPYKMFLYTKPMDNGELASMEWIQNLMVHETRHIAQFNQFNKGFTNLAYRVLGYNGWQQFMYSVPAWFYEGDAVYAETVYTDQGRGRNSLFDMPIQAILMSRQKLYPYDKMVLRSYRDMIPNHYPVGYMLVTGARRQFGNDVFARVSERSKNYSFLPFAFAQGFKSVTGIPLRQNYRNSYTELQNLYNKREDSIIKHSDYPRVNSTAKRFNTSYRYPKFISDNEILCIKSSMSKTSRFLVIDTTGKLVRDYGLTDASTYETDGRVVVYGSEVPDLRWRLRDFNDIAVLDLKTGKRQLVSHKQRYFTPTISADGRYVAAIEFNDKSEESIVVFKLERKYAEYCLEPYRQFSVKAGHWDSPENEYIRLPKFAGNGKIVFVSTSGNKNSIKSFDINTLAVDTLLNPTYDNINDLAVDQQGNIYFSADHEGVMNIYKLPEGSREAFRITRSRFGALAPSVRHGKLVFNDYTALGYDIAITDVSDIQSDVHDGKLNYFAPMLEREPAGSLSFISEQGTTGDILQNSKKYHQYSDPVRLLGWMPSVSNDALMVTVESENNLETLYITAQEAYFTDPGFWRTGLSVRYCGFYPVFDFTASLGDNGDYALGFDDNLDLVSNTYIWKENILTGTVTLPFDLSRFHYIQELSLSAGVSYYMIEGKPFGNYQDLGNGNFPTFNASLSYSWRRPKAYRDFKSPLALSASVGTTKSLDRNWDAEMHHASLGFTVPGIFRQNYLSVNGQVARQSQTLNERKVFLFSSPIYDIGGYETIRMRNLARVKADYSFPMGYPDFGLPPVVWIKRFRGSLNAEVARGQFFNMDLNFASVGGKLLMDFNVLRNPTEISLGISVNHGLIQNGLERTEWGLILDLPF